MWRRVVLGFLVGFLVGCIAGNGFCGNWCVKGWLETADQLRIRFQQLDSCLLHLAAQDL